MAEDNKVVVDVWGRLACFTRPEAKVERYSYSAMTPSAARGVLSAIYFKPIEFYYQIEKIEIINPIKRINIKTNEITDKILINKKQIKYIYIDDKRTQRNTNYLKDPYYRITARIIKLNDFKKHNITGLVAQFNQRVEKGKCFYQPYLGTKECIAYFSPPNYDKKPLDINMDLGIMLYDVFNIKNNIPDKYDISLFNAKIQNGEILVPEYDGPQIIRLNKYVMEAKHD